MDKILAEQHKTVQKYTDKLIAYLMNVCHTQMMSEDLETCIREITLFEKLYHSAVDPKLPRDRESY